jgi:biopolymer transport protein TolQ
MISYFRVFLDADIVGKGVLITLIFSSIYTWSVVIKKIFALIKLHYAVKEFKEYVAKMPQLKRLIIDEKNCHFEVYDGLFEIYLSGYMEENKREKVEMCVEKVQRVWEMKLESELEYLSIIGSIAPFVGLFGTVYGIMNSFQSIATSNSSSIAVVAPGISEALFATAIGLFVAIPAVISASVIYSKIEILMKDLWIFAFSISDRLSAINKKK